ncbi:MAG: glycosyltransferase family 4 protein [Elusimicrobia bacterium]|nr:glycosyltransferase family 4 protein [Elusimicrobiota bacterium]
MTSNDLKSMTFVEPRPSPVVTTSSPGSPPSSNIQRMLWLTSTLNQIGGGERLLLEGKKFFENQNIETVVLAGRFSPKALFDGTYSSHNIISLGLPPLPNKKITQEVFRRIRLLPMIHREIRRLKPDIVLCQSEYDCILLWGATLFNHQPYAVLIFGQMFQFAENIAKYTLVFRKHLKEIRASRPGYMATVPLKAPRRGILNRLTEELSAVLRYIAVRKAKKIFTISPQVGWEVRKLYGRDSTVLKGAYPPSIFNYEQKKDVRKMLGLENKRLFLTISRLVPKKRVDLCLKAFGEVVKNRPDAHFVIGGVGFEEQNLKRLAHDLGLDSSTTFVGHISEKELWDYYCGCDVFLNMDVADVGLAAYAASALGKRVICSADADDEADPVQRMKSPFLFSDFTPQNLAALMEEALTRPWRMTPDQKEWLQKFTWEAYFGAILRELSLPCL